MLQYYGKLKPTIYAESLPPAIFQPYFRRPERKDVQAAADAADGLSVSGETGEDQPDA